MKQLKKIILLLVALLLIFILVLFIRYRTLMNQDAWISEGPLVQHGMPQQPALLVIDVQEGTTGSRATNPYYMQHAAEVIGNINKAAMAADEQDIPVIYIRSEITDYLINLLNNSLEQGQPGANLDARLELVPGPVVIKHWGDSFRDTGLDSLLLSQNVTELIITGLDLNACVDKTVRAAENRRYKIRLLEDAVLAGSDSLKIIALERFGNNGATVESTEAFIMDLQSTTDYPVKSE